MKDYIDILHLYANSNSDQWNAFLRDCYKNNDVQKLTDTLKRLQRGMNRLVSQKMNTEKVCVLFIRLQRSIENTLRDIHRKKNPNPLFQSGNNAVYSKHIDDKRKKQNDLEMFLRKERY